MKTKCPHCNADVEVSDASVELALKMQTGVLTACFACGKSFVLGTAKVTLKIGGI